MTINSERSNHRNGMSPHKIGLTLAAGSLLFANASQALTIGKPQLDSYLAQPLLVFVPITDLAAGKQSSNYNIRALPTSEYSALGLAQPGFPLQNLEMNWVSSATGEAQILISSQRPVIEPVVTVLLEIRNRRQRWVRQLNLLLDPAPVGLSAAPAASPSRHRMEALTSPASRATHYGPVGRGEVLSIIAQKVRMDPKIPLPKMAQAIINANRETFRNGPHSLSAGVMLKIPTSQQIAQASAYAAVTAPPKSANSLSVKSAHRHRKGAHATRVEPPPFLPDYQHLNGHFYALSLEFLSYEDVRPVNLQATLQALEAAEPSRFRADWTLSPRPTQSSFESAAHAQAARSPLSLASAVAPASSVQESIAPPALITAAQDRPAAARVVKDNAQRKRTPAFANIQEQAPQNLQSTNAPDESLQDRKKVAKAESSLFAVSASSGTESAKPIAAAKSDSMRWLWWLLLLAAAALLAWRQRERWQPGQVKSKISQPAPMLAKTQPHNDERNRGPSPSVKSADDDIVRQAVVRRLKPALESTEEAMVRQAKVALSLFDRGRIEESENRIDELLLRIDEQNAQAQKGQNTAAVSRSASTESALKNQAQPAPVENSELEQRRLLKAIRKLLNANLSNESERQLKVATALGERGNIERAQQILVKVQKQLQEQDAVERSVR